MKRRGRMEEYELEPGEICEYTTSAFTRQSSLAYPDTAPHQGKHFGPPRFDTAAGSSRNKKKNKKAKITHQFSPENNVPVTKPAPAPAPQPVLTPKPTTPSVSSCYIFKSRLQEYAQRAGFETPYYETTKEGPPHEPIFSSTVILNGVRYDSLPGFFNRKASEQSAAEVALSQLSHSADMKFGITVPVNETGLSKNLLQEYAQKMNYAVPLYECSRITSKKIMYSCTVDVGGTKYIGAPASAKKEAEIKAARVALLAIQYAASEDPAGKSVHVVIPQKKKSSDLGISNPDTVSAPKPKRSNKQRKRKYNNKRGKKAAGGLEVKMDGEQTGAELVESGDVSFEQSNSGKLNIEATINDSNTGVFDEFLVPLNGGDFENGLDVKMLDQADALVDMDVQESGVTHNVSSQEKATGVSKHSGLRYLYKANILSCQGTDSEVGYMETALDNCSSGFNKGIEENALTVSSEGLHIETLDIKADVFRSQHDMTGDVIVGEAGLESREMDSVINVVSCQGIVNVNDLVSSNERVLIDESDINMFDQEAGLNTFTAAKNKGIDENAPNKQNGVPNNCREGFDGAGASTNKIKILWHSCTCTSQNNIANDVMAGGAGLESDKAIDDSGELNITTKGVSEEGVDVKMCNQESGLSAFSTIADDFVMCMTEKGGVELGPSDGGDSENGLDVKVLSQTDALVVDMDGQESGVTHNVSSQEKAADVSKEFSAANILSCQGTDWEVGHIETAPNNCSSGFDKGVEENVLAVSREGLHKEMLDIKTDGQTVVESTVTDVFRSQHDMTDAVVVGEAGLKSGEIDASSQEKATYVCGELSVTNVIICQGTNFVNALVPSHEGVLNDVLDVKMFDQESGSSTLKSTANDKGIEENALAVTNEGLHTNMVHVETDGVPKNTEMKNSSQPSTKKPSSVSSIDIWSAQCGECLKWRVIHSQEEYEEIRARFTEEPFVCSKKLYTCCDDPADIEYDISRTWVIDKPNLPKTPSGFKRQIKVRNFFVKTDCYYTTPNGKLIRSSVELRRFLDENPEYKTYVSDSDFSFSRPMIMQDTIPPAQHSRNVSCGKKRESCQNV